MQAIVYTSNTGHTAAYAEMLGKLTGLSVYSLKDAAKHLDKGARVIYLGWLFAGSVKGYKKANKRFAICAVCAVGLCDTGTALESTRKTNSIPDDVALFTMQGGMDKEKLHGINRFMIDMLTKGMCAKEAPSEDEKRMIYLLTHDQDYVCEENTASFMQWYQAQKQVQ